MKVHHLNILATEEDIKQMNRVGRDGEPRFTMHTDITFGGDVKAALAGWVEGAYRWVATINHTDSLDDAFRLTNHINEAWNTDPERTGMIMLSDPKAHDEGRLGVRSTSVGDIIETDDGELFLVAGFGFEKLPLKTAIAEIEEA